MVLPVVPLVLGIAGSAVTAATTWYANLPGEEKDRINRVLINLILRRYGKAAEDLTREEAKEVVVEVVREEGGPAIT
jgi:uncharacterized protein (DUF697 family)